MKKNVLLTLTPTLTLNHTLTFGGFRGNQVKNGIIFNYVSLSRCYFFDLTQNKAGAIGDPNYTQVTLKMISSLTRSVPSL